MVGTVQRDLVPGGEQVRQQRSLNAGADEEAEEGGVCADAVKLGRHGVGVAAARPVVEGEHHRALAGSMSGRHAVQRRAEFTRRHQRFHLGILPGPPGRRPASSDATRGWSNTGPLGCAQI